MYRHGDQLGRVTDVICIYFSKGIVRSLYVKKYLIGLVVSEKTML